MRAIRRPLDGILGIPRFILETDNLLLLLAGIGIGLAFTWFIRPFVIDDYAPFLDPAVTCNRLAPPSGGNNRSLLALRGNDEQKLAVDVRLLNTTLTQGDSLRVDVFLNNEDAGPIILYMPEVADVVAGSTTPYGIRLVVRDIISNAEVTYGLVTTNRDTRPYADATLHLLEAHNRCKQSYELDLPLGTGEYSILAQYINDDAGLNTDPNPLFPTQNVWNGGIIQSPELRFSIVPEPTVVPTAIPPAAPAG